MGFVIDLPTQHTHAMATNPWMYFGLIAGELVWILALTASIKCGKDDKQFSLAAPLAAFFGLVVVGGCVANAISSDILSPVLPHGIQDGFGITIVAVGGVLLLAGLSI